MKIRPGVGASSGGAVLRRVLCFAGMLLLMDRAGFPSTWKALELLGEYRTAPWKAGPFRLKPLFTLSEAGYDSNLYGSPDHPVGDYGFVITPGMKAYLRPSRRFVFVAAASAGYTYFLRTVSERAWNNSIEGQAHLLLNRVLISVSAARSDAREMLNTEIILIRPRIRTETLEGSLLLQSGGRTSLAVTVGETKTDFANDITGFRLSLLNRTEGRILVVGRHEFSAKFRFDLELGLSRVRFEDPESLQNSRGTSVAGLFSFSPQNRLAGTARIGLIRYVPLARVKSAYGGIFGDASLSYKPFRFCVIRFSARRGFPYSYAVSDTYFVMNSWRVGASFELNRRIRLDLDHAEGKNLYPEKTEPRALTNSFRMNAAGVMFRVSPKIGIGITAGFQDQYISMPRFDGFSRGFVMARFETNF